MEQATADDIVPWLDLAREVEALFGADMAGDPRFHEYLQRSVARGSALCVRVGGELAGAMTFRNGWIQWLAVRQQYRRRGVGRALVLHAIGAGEGEIRVTTFGEHHPHTHADASRRFYLRLGFVPSGEAPESAPDSTPREVLAWRPREGPLH